VLPLAHRAERGDEVQLDARGHGRAPTRGDKCRAGPGGGDAKFAPPCATPEAGNV